jgi:hypothetical protein
MKLSRARVRESHDSNWRPFHRPYILCSKLRITFYHLLHAVLFLLLPPSVLFPWQPKDDQAKPLALSSNATAVFAWRPKARQAKAALLQAFCSAAIRQIFCIFRLCPLLLLVFLWTFACYVWAGLQPQNYKKIIQNYIWSLFCALNRLMMVCRLSAPAQRAAEEWV